MKGWARRWALALAGVPLLVVIFAAAILQDLGNAIERGARQLLRRLDR